MKQKYIEPEKDYSAFNCPVCGAYAHQEWYKMGGLIKGIQRSALLEIVFDGKNVFDVNRLREKYRKLNITRYSVKECSLACCAHCAGISIWLDEKMIFPDSIVVESPNQDLNKDIKEDYIEAASVLQKSPRASAALLRLCLQKLCKQLGMKGKNIDTDIGSLVKNGLSKKIQKSLDVVRVVGNDAVHPGVMDIKDNKEVAIILFKLLNSIAYDLLTHPKEVDAIFETLPKNKKEAIKKRDSSVK